MYRSAFHLRVPVHVCFPNRIASALPLLAHAQALFFSSSTFAMSKQQKTIGSFFAKPGAVPAVPVPAKVAADESEDAPVTAPKRRRLLGAKPNGAASSDEETQGPPRFAASAASPHPTPLPGPAASITAVSSSTAASCPEHTLSSNWKTGDAITIASMTSPSYHPILSAPFPTPLLTSVPFASLAGVFAAIESTTKRNTITLVLCNFFRSLILYSNSPSSPPFSSPQPSDLLAALYICSNALAPAYMSLELGVGDSILLKALAEATGRQVKDIKAEAEERGDLGDVAAASRTQQRTIFGAMGAPASQKAGLTIAGVYQAFKGIALESGKASQEKKVTAIKKLLVHGSGTEAKYLIRALQGKLRIGLAKQTVLIALAQAFAITAPITEGRGGETSTHAASGMAGEGRDDAVALPADILADIVLCPPIPDNLSVKPSSNYEMVCPGGADGITYVVDTRRGKGEAEVDALLLNASIVLKQVYSELPSYDRIIPAMMQGGVLQARRTCALSPGVPVTPMLAKPTKGVREILTRFEDVSFTCEWKYDGERAQVHKTPDGSFSIFSRNSENTTGKYPDIGLVLKDAAAAEVAIHTCVLDGEVVAYDREKHTLMPFQVLSTRARKDVAVEDIKVQVIYVAFDLLYINGLSLLHTPLTKRRAILRRLFKEVPGKFGFATSAESSDVEEIAAFLNDSVKGGCEGLMVKVLDGPESVYEPSKRSLNWLKLKKDYMNGLTDTLDLVPIGAWLGKGKRTGVYGAYLLACYDPEDECYQSVTRIGTGFSDEMLAELTAAFQAKGSIVSSKPSNALVGDSVADCDVWFDPDKSEVWEVQAADLSISPVHMAAIGKVDSAKGIALRFPRFMRRRDDKDPADATSADQVADMYRGQSSTIASNVNDDDDWDM
jgi:DNA ligase-1